MTISLKVLSFSSSGKKKKGKLWQQQTLYYGNDWVDHIGVLPSACETCVLQLVRALLFHSLPS